MSMRFRFFPALAFASLLSIAVDGQQLQITGQVQQYNVSGLPGASSNNGTVIWVRDSNTTTVGATCTGGGTNYVPCKSNGTNWLVVAPSGAAGGGMTNPMTSAGDLIYGGASGAPTRLGAGATGYVLTSNGLSAAPSWQASSGGGGTAATPYVDAEALGILANGSDQSTAIQSAVNSLQTGQTLFFSCKSGSTYTVKSPISFAHLVDMNLMGAGEGCNLGFYPDSGTANYGFSFQGAERINVKDIGFYTGSTAPPEVVMLLARPSANPGGQSGQFNFSNVRVEGYATQAIVYSIASEENEWHGPTIIVNGGGAKYGFYTSGYDDLGVNAASISASGAQSNLSLWMDNFHLLDFSSSIDTTHELIRDVSNNSGAGDHTYRDGYGASSGGTCFAIANLQHDTSGHPENNPYYQSNGSLTFDSLRCENQAIMFLLDTPNDQSVGDIRILNSRSATGVNPNYFISSNSPNYASNPGGSARVYGLLMTGNVIDSSNIPYTSYKLPNLYDSYINEAYGPVNYLSAQSTVIISRNHNGTVGNYYPDLKANSGTRYVCIDTTGKLVSQTSACSGT